MSNYATLKAAIQSAVYTNGNNEITGSALQTVLLQMVDAVADGYIFKGVATPGTSPGTPDENVFYIGGAGYYTNFGTNTDIKVGSIGVFTYSGSWSTSVIDLYSASYTDNAFDALAADSLDFTIDASKSSANGIYLDSDLTFKANGSQLGVYIPVTKGMRFIVQVRDCSTLYARYGFCGAVPSEGGTAYTYALASLTEGDMPYTLRLTSTVNGYFFISGATSCTYAFATLVDSRDPYAAVENMFSVNDAMTGTYLANGTGVITTGGATAYKCVKLQLEAGVYWINIQGTGTQDGMWQYSDGTYATPTEQIIGKLSQPVSSLYTLEAGYYALAWNDGNGSGTDTGMAFICRNSDVKEGVVKDIDAATRLSDALMYGMQDVTGTQLDGLYIAGGTKKITANGSQKGLYLHVDAGDVLRLSSDFINLTPRYGVCIGTPAAGDTALDYNVIYGDYGTRLDAYYVAPFTGTFFISSFYTAGATLPVRIRKGSFLKHEDRQVYGNKTGLLDGFTVMGGGFTVASDGRSATSTATGSTARIYYPVPTFEDKFNISAVITPLTANGSGYFEHVVGKWNTTAGGAYGIGKDASGTYLVGYDCEGTMTHKFYFTGLDVALNKRCTLLISKRTAEASTLEISITDYHGNVYTVSGIGNGEELTGDTVAGNDFSTAVMWGNLCAWSNIGTMKIEGVSFGYAPLTTQDLSLLIIGHSFVEGNSLPYDKDKRFATLLSDDIGAERVLILGKGGVSANGVLECIGDVSAWNASAKYALLVIGTNDADDDDTIYKFEQIDGALRSHGIRTVWATIPPRSGGETHPTCNAYIKASFDYVDISGVFYKADGTIDTSMFLGDGIHPTIAAHAKIFSVIKAGCSYIYNV